MRIRGKPGIELERQPIRLAEAETPRLLVVIDTEEEFDWDLDFDRSSTSVSAMGEAHRGQEIFEEYDLVPTYVVDYPVATQEEGYGPVREFVARGKAELGAHLHPWVTPPLIEDVNRFNSYAGNLPVGLESAKLARLMEEIESSFGIRPVIYKAGRYGFGPNTAAILEEQGVEIDLSWCPAFDFSADGGPDYSGQPSDPYWFGSERQLLGLPATGSFVGLLAGQGSRLHKWASRPLSAALRAPAVLARLRVADRLHLSPEGFGVRELIRLTDSLLQEGLRLFSLSFHSPSLKPGCTPYTQTEADVRKLLDDMRRYFDYFLGTLNGATTTPSQFRRHLLTLSGGTSS